MRELYGVLTYKLRQHLNIKYATNFFLTYHFNLLLEQFSLS